MRKITAGLFISLDGVVEAPEKWQFPYFNEEVGQKLGESMAASDTILLGRRTYQEFAGYWPNQGSEVPFADHMNNTPKFIVSTTLKKLDWQNSTQISSNVLEEISKLKQQSGRNISITGSPTLVRSLLRNNLIDELGLVVCPLVVGTGMRLFEEGTDQLPLELVESKAFRTGALSLTYRPAAT